MVVNRALDFKRVEPSSNQGSILWPARVFTINGSNEPRSSGAWNIYASIGDLRPPLRYAARMRTHYYSLASAVASWGRRSSSTSFLERLAINATSAFDNGDTISRGESHARQHIKQRRIIGEGDVEGTSRHTWVVMRAWRMCVARCQTLAIAWYPFVPRVGPAKIMDLNQ